MREGGMPAHGGLGRPPDRRGWEMEYRFRLPRLRSVRPPKPGAYLPIPRDNGTTFYRIGRSGHLYSVMESCMDPGRMSLDRKEVPLTCGREKPAFP